MLKEARGECAALKTREKSLAEVGHLVASLVSWGWHAQEGSRVTEKDVLPQSRVNWGRGRREAGEGSLPKLPFA